MDIIYIMINKINKINKINLKKKYNKYIIYIKKIKMMNFYCIYNNIMIKMEIKKNMNIYHKIQLKYIIILYKIYIINN